MIRLLPFVSSLVARTLRMKIEGEVPEKAVVIFWHGKMFAGWFVATRKEQGKRPRPVALVSPSKDGDILSSVLKRWGYKVQRGSSSRSGLEALRRAIDSVKSGECDRIVITPDGPRGPIHRLKRGAFLAAQELQLPVYFLRIHYRRAKVLGKSWDKFEIPLPFSGIHISVEEIRLDNYPEPIEEQHAWLNRLVAERNM
jgi:Kdo2-lipid IVA 3' secondary acyltransferase